VLLGVVVMGSPHHEDKSGVPSGLNEDWEDEIPRGTPQGLHEEAKVPVSHLRLSGWEKAPGKARRLSRFNLSLDNGQISGSVIRAAVCRFNNKCKVTGTYSEITEGKRNGYAMQWTVTTAGKKPKSYTYTGKFIRRSSKHHMGGDSISGTFSAGAGSSTKNNNNGKFLLVHKFQD